MLLLVAQALLLGAVVLRPRVNAQWRMFFVERRLACWPGGSGAPAAAPHHCLRRPLT